MSRGNHASASGAPVGSSGRTLRNVGAWLATCLAALVALAGWSLASPVGSSPDDDYHLASIWCAQGTDQDHCRAVEGDDTMRAVPLLASGAGTCFATDFTISGSCQDDLTSPVPEVVTNRGNWGGSYPPYFYRLMSVFVSTDVSSAVLVMRLVNSVLTVALVAGLAVLLPRRRRPLAAVPLMLTAVPLSISVLASTNPSGWAVLGAGLLWPALYVAYEVDGWRRNALAAYAVLAAFIASGGRADGCLFTMMSVALVMIMRARHLRRSPVVTAAAAVCFALAAAIFLSAGQSSALTAGGGEGVPPGEATTSQLLLMNLAALPTLWLGIFSSGPLGRTGWLDTPFPPVVSMLTIAVWFAVLLQGWRRMFPAKLVGLVIVGAALIVQPMYLLMQARVVVGAYVQPRYLLPIVVIFTGLAILGTLGVALRLGRLGYWSVVGFLGLAHSVALHIQIRRYVTGLDVSEVRFGDSPEWWWDSGPGPTDVWVVASIAFTVVTAAVLRQCLVRQDPRRGSDHAATGADRSAATPLHSA